MPLTPLEWGALFLGLFVGGLVAGYKIIPDRIFREMDRKKELGKK